MVVWLHHSCDFFRGQPHRCELRAVPVSTEPRAVPVLRGWRGCAGASQRHQQHSVQQARFRHSNEYYYIGLAKLGTTLLPCSERHSTAGIAAAAPVVGPTPNGACQEEQEQHKRLI